MTTVLVARAELGIASAAYVQVSRAELIQAPFGTPNRVKVARAELIQTVIEPFQLLNSGGTFVSARITVL